MASDTLLKLLVLLLTASLRDITVNAGRAQAGGKIQVKCVCQQVSETELACLLSLLK